MAHLDMAKLYPRALIVPLPIKSILIEKIISSLSKTYLIILSKMFLLWLL